MAATSKGELNSAVGFKGIGKKVYVLVLVGVVYC
ncbi:phage holin family protein [bacterium LRH843]|nr:phage holin family protein [bacterium LRH843]